MNVGRILIVGATGSSHIGGSLMRAAQELSIDAILCDRNLAWRHGTIRQKLLWEFGGKRPIGLKRFSNLVIEACRNSRPETLIATGNAPIDASALRECRQIGVRCLNYSTDDPFNPRHRAAWFLRALCEYDTVFTPRRSNLKALKQHGCGRVEYLPFGYDPTLFFPVSSGGCESDLFFAGAAEAERVPYIAAAVKAGLNVRLHGIYWDRFAKTRGISRGQADIPTLREAIASCKVALCLVRHENRDGHSMRSFEVPAVGACMVVEDTEEHRQIFGKDGTRVIYFKTAGEMVERARMLLANEILRRSLRDNVHLYIINGGNTYADRLASMINAL